MQDGIVSRKEAHLRLSLSEGVRGAGASLGEVVLPYDACFCVAPGEMDYRTTVGGQGLLFPLVLGCMTGGTAAATAFNTALRRCAQAFGIGLGLGSIRALLEDESLLETYGVGEVDWLYGNLGVSEIMRGVPAAAVREALSKLGACGLFVHLNILQEWLQPEGDRALWTDMARLGAFVEALGYPVIVKEVGSGIGGVASARLGQLSIAGLETSSRGGTSWVRVESCRGAWGGMAGEAVLSALDGLGVEMPAAIRDCRRAMGDRSVIASGGIEDGAMLVKALYLGADAVAVAQPLYRVWCESGEEGLLAYVEALITCGRLVWRSTGARDLESLWRLRAECAPGD